MDVLLTFLLFSVIIVLSIAGGRILSKSIHGEQPKDKYPYPYLRGYIMVVGLSLMLVVLFIMKLLE
jgi:hypothetical protein